MAIGENKLGVRLELTGAQQVAAALKTVQNQLSAAANAAKSVAVGGAALLGLKAGTSAIQHQLEAVVELGAQMAVLSKQTSSSVSSLVALRRAFFEAGVDSSSLGTVLVRTSKAIGEAALNGGAAAKGISELGLSASELSTMDPARQFVTLAQRIGQVENPSMRAAIAMEIFGRSASEMLPVLNNPDLLRGVTEGAGKFGAVMQRNAERFHDFEVARAKLSRVATSIYAGVADMLPVDQITDAINRALKAVDYVGFGQTIGGFVALVIQRWKEGRLGELISLTIDAGFEAGKMAAAKAWAWVRTMVANPSFWIQVVDVLITAINSIAKGIAGLFFAVHAPTDALGIYIGDRLAFAFASVWEAFKQGAADAINFLATHFEPVLTALKHTARTILPGFGGLSSSPVSLGRVEAIPGNVTSPRSWAQAMAEATKRAGSMTSDANAFFDSGTSAARQLLGISSNANLSTGERLRDLLAQIKGLVEDRAKAEHDSAETGKEHVAIINKRLQLEEALRLNQEKIQQAQAIYAKIEGDFSVTKADKWIAKRTELQTEARLLERNVELLRQKASIETDPGAREQMLGRVDSASGQLNRVNREIGSSGANPYSVSEQMTSQLTALQDKWGTVAENIARTITDTIGTAVSSISEGITGLIMQTKTWGQALRSIYTSVLTALIQGIVQMGVQWMLTHVFMKGITIAWHALLNALGWQQVAQSNAQEAAKTPGLAVNASLASAGSYGTSAVVGIALMLAMIGVAIAAATGAFAQGGLVNGPGGPTSDSILARLSAGEYVIPAAQVDRLGTGYFDSIRAGGTPVSSGGSNQNVHVYFDRAEFLKASRDDIGSIAINAMKRGRA